MRRFFHGGLLVAVTAVAAPAWADPPPAGNPGIAATVNGEPIPLDRVDAFIKDKLAVTPVTAAQARQLRTEVVNDLIDDLLLKQFLAKNAPKVEPAEIDRHLAAFTASLTRRGKTFAAFLKETNQTEVTVRESWATLLQLNGYVKQHVPDEQLKAYHAANKDYFDRVEVRVSHVVVRVGPTTPPTEKALAKEKLQRLRAEIAAGKLDFAAAAKKHSQCPSAPQGGDLGYILRKDTLVDEAVGKAAFALKPGAVSEVVETTFGLHLITVTDRKPGTPVAFETCVEEVRDAFAEDFRTELVGKLRKQAQVQVTVP
jgi:peptidyl-prolyl cis-trans isomerase C